MEIKRFIDGKEVVITLTEDEVQDAGRIAEFQQLCAAVKEQIGYTTYKKAFADMTPEKLAEAVEDIASDVGYELTYYSGKACQMSAISEAMQDYCKNNALPEDPGTPKVEEEKSLFELFDTMDDSTERYEAFVECCLSEINSDDEPWRKKGRALALALMRNEANEAVTALCGWYAESIAKKAMLIRDDQEEFHDEPVEGEITAYYGDGYSASAECKVSPKTHEVYDFDEAIFNYDGKPLMSVTVRFSPVGDFYQFVCTEATAMPENVAEFWFKVQE